MNREETMLIIIGVIAIVTLIAFALAILIMVARGMMKKEAYRLLEEPDPDPKDIRRISSQLGKLAGTDAEARELVRKLMDRT